MTTRLFTGRATRPRLLTALLALAAVAAMLLPSAAAARDRQPDMPAGQGRPGDDPRGAQPGGDQSNAAADTSGNGNGGGGGGGVTVTSALNLRSGPSLDAEVLTVMATGSAVEVTGDPENGFYPVTYDGVPGYAYGDYLSIGAGIGDDAASPPAASDGGTSDGTTMVGAGESDIVAIIYAAAAAYGQSGDDMLRVATCESGLDPSNVTPPYDASGLFQFLPSTWASTPFADQDIFDPVASANAAAWMWSVGRRGEWVCQ